VQADQSYRRLREILDVHPSGCPEAPEIYEILEILFTREEARAACGLGFIPRDAEEVAQRAGLDPRDARAHLEAMASRGLVYAREKDGRTGYALLPVMPGLFEFPFMRGDRSPELDRLAGLWKTYLDRLGRELGSPSMRLTRVVPIQEEVENEPGALPFELLDAMIDSARSLGIAHCACREVNAACDAPREACMLFDETCDFLVERGYGRRVSREEMKRLLREFDQAGLVHQVNNSRDKLTFVCNCCPCCCELLRARLRLGNPNVVNPSAFLPEVDTGLCTGCAACAEERCPAGAMRMVEGLAEVDEEKCIGCGLCVTGCPSRALRLKRRPAAAVPAESSRELGRVILEEKGRLYDFLKLNFG